MLNKNPPFTHNVFVSKNRNNEVALKVNYKKRQGRAKPISYILTLNGNVILNSKEEEAYLGLWTPFIDLCLDPARPARVLIVGGGNQFLSNYLLKKFPVNITIVDENAYLYLQHNFKDILKTKTEYVKYNPEDGMYRKMLPIDETLEDAFDDMVIKEEEFDLILVDNYVDSYKIKTGMYEPHIAHLYHKLLKPKGSLIINHNFSIKEYSPKSRQTMDVLELKNTKDDVDYYRNYLNTLNSLLVETDYLYKKDTKIALYSKVYVGKESEFD